MTEPRKRETEDALGEGQRRFGNRALHLANPCHPGVCGPDGATLYAYSLWRRLGRRFDLDLLLGLDGFRLLRKRDRQHTLLEARLDFVGVDTFRYGEGALERAEAAFV